VAPSASCGIPTSQEERSGPGASLWVAAKLSGGGRGDSNPRPSREGVGLPRGEEFYARKRTFGCHRDRKPWCYLRVRGGRHIVNPARRWRVGICLAEYLQPCGLLNRVDPVGARQRRDKGSFLRLARLHAGGCQKPPPLRCGIWRGSRSDATPLSRSRVDLT
jgi:hypothetical protein